MHLPFIRIVAAHWVPLGAFRPRQQRHYRDSLSMRHAPRKVTPQCRRCYRPSACSIQHAVQRAAYNMPHSRSTVRPVLTTGRNRSCRCLRCMLRGTLHLHCRPLPSVSNPVGRMLSRLRVGPVPLSPHLHVPPAYRCGPSRPDCSCDFRIVNCGACGLPHLAAHAADHENVCHSGPL